jgi:hypothetical protein
MNRRNLILKRDMMLDTRNQLVILFNNVGLSFFTASTKNAVYTEVKIIKLIKTPFQYSI